jgi:hypothetical protein
MDWIISYWWVWVWAIFAAITWGFVHNATKEDYDE